MLVKWLLAANLILMFFISVGCSSSGNIIDLSSVITDTTNTTDVTAPILTGTMDDGTTSSSLGQSPTLSWPAATDTGGSGVSYYQIAIGTTSGGSNTLTWTRVGNVTSFLVSGLSLTTSTTYFASVRAVDVAGNVSTAIQGDGWVVSAAAAAASINYGWQAEAYLKAPNAGAGDSFGLATAVSGDTIVVGAENEASNQTTITNGTTASSDDSAGNSGAVYVFKRTGVTWAQEAYLKAPNAESNDKFGTSVAINGDTVVVGASRERSNQTTITNGTTASSDNSLSQAGAAYVFKRTGVTWAQEAYLKPPNIQGTYLFGSTVAVSGDTVIVGARGERSNQTTITNGTTASSDTSEAQAGAAYVFKRTGVIWAQEAYLKPPNTHSLAAFGVSVSIHGDTAVVGASGEWSNQTTITNGTTASSDNTASFAGAAYVFKRTGTTWAQEAYLKASNTEPNDQFGIGVAINGDTIVVGANNEDSNQTTITNGTTASSDNSASTSGAAYVFKRTGITWAQEAYLKAPNSNASDYFGYKVSLHGDTLAVGAMGESSNQTTITNGTSASSDNSALTSGAAYVFRRTGTTWAQEAYLKAPNAGAADSFGTSVSISGDTVVVGASLESSNQTTITNGTTASSDNSASTSGAAYVFNRTGTTWAHEAYLKAPNADGGDYFGGAVSVSGDTIVVGAYLEDSNQTTVTNGATASSNNLTENSGAAYVFKRTGNTWTQEAYLKAPNPDNSDLFGSTVVVDGDTVAVGASYEESNQTTITNGNTASSNNSLGGSGAAYIFKR
jgi:hypothetical protein